MHDDPQTRAEPGIEPVPVAAAPDATATGADMAPVGPDAAPPAPATAAPVAVPELSPAACAARLIERFPAVFAPGQAKPLKLRIQADIQQRDPGVFTKKSLSIFLHRHTTSTAYLRALANAPGRFDLDGAPAGELSDEHRQAAIAELDRRRALHEARRAAERDAQRDAQRAAREAAARDRAADDAARRPPRDAAAPGLNADGANPRPARAAAARERRTDDPARRPRRESAAPERRPDGAARGAAGDAPVRERSPDDEARRARATLLHTYETSTLTRSNFCALKGISEAELEATLAQAKQERALRPPLASRPPMGDVRAAGPGPRPDRPSDRSDRPDQRGPRQRPPADARAPRKR